MKPTWVCLNGEFLEESVARIPVTDRAFLYGDGIFETLRVYRGRPFVWRWHLERLRGGAAILGLSRPRGRLLLRWVGELLERNRMAEAVVRLQITRGSGRRGYSPVGAGPALCLITVHPAPSMPSAEAAGTTLVTSGWRISGDDRLAACKHTSRLIHVLASAEARAAAADDALLLNQRGQVVEATGANFFWFAGNLAHTPPLASGALPGVTRRLVFELAAGLGIEIRERTLAARQLQRVAGGFLTSSVQGLRWVRRIDGRSLVRHAHFDRLHRAYRQRIEEECGR